MKTPQVLLLKFLSPVLLVSSLMSFANAEEVKALYNTDGTGDHVCSTSGKFEFELRKDVPVPMEQFLTAIACGSVDPDKLLQGKAKATPKQVNDCRRQFATKFLVPTEETVRTMIQASVESLKKADTPENRKLLAKFQSLQVEKDLKKVAAGLAQILFSKEIMTATRHVEESGTFEGPPATTLDFAHKFRLESLNSKEGQEEKKFFEEEPRYAPQRVDLRLGNEDFIGYHSYGNERNESILMDPNYYRQFNPDLTMLEFDPYAWIFGEAGGRMTYYNTSDDIYHQVIVSRDPARPVYWLVLNHRKGMGMVRIGVMEIPLGESRSLDLPYSKETDGVIKNNLHFTVKCENRHRQEEK